MALLALLWACAGDPPVEPVSTRRAGDPVGEAPPIPVAAPPVEGVAVRGVYASVREAVALLDHDASTTWSVAGDGVGDRVEVRLEEPLVADEIELQGCPMGSGPVRWSVRAGGVVAGELQVVPGGTARLALGARAGALRTFGLRVIEGADACLAEVSLRAGGVAFPLSPPRTVRGTVRVSSVHTPPEAFHPYLLVDGRPWIGWAAGKGGGVGEEVRIQLDAPFALEAVELWNGDASFPEARAAAGRLTRVGISLDGGGRVLLSVPDREGPLLLPAPSHRPVQAIRVAILEATGSPVHVGELRLRDALGPVAIATPLRGDRETIAITEASATGERWRDKRLVSACDGGGTVLRLRSNQDLFLVAVDDVAGAYEIGGEWALAGGKTPWSTLRWFGRRLGQPDPEGEGAPYLEQVELTLLDALKPEALAELKLTCRDAEGRPRELAALSARGAVLLRRKEAVEILLPALAP